MSVQTCSKALFVQLQQKAKEFPGSPKEGHAVALSIKHLNDDLIVREVRCTDTDLIFLCQSTHPSKHFGVIKAYGESVGVSLKLFKLSDLHVGGTVFTDQTDL